MVLLRLVELYSGVLTNDSITAIIRIITQEGVCGIRVHTRGFIGSEQFAVIGITELASARIKFWRFPFAAVEFSSCTSPPLYETLIALRRRN